MTVQEPIHQRDAVAANVHIERIYRDWDAALSENNVAALLSLYAVYAELQSPLVSHLMNKEEGVCRGKADGAHRTDRASARIRRRRSAMKDVFAIRARQRLVNHTIPTPVI